MNGFHSNHFSIQKPMLEMLESWLKHKSDMVNIEAARAICEMKNVSAQQLVRPISSKYLSSRIEGETSLLICDSFTDGFKFSKNNFEICGYSDSCNTCLDSSRECGYL